MRIALMRATVTLGLVLLSSLAAGCASPSESTRAACASTFITIHYDAAPDTGALLTALDHANYTWTPRTDRIIDASSPDGVPIVLSTDPGSSGPALVISLEDPSASATKIRQAAQDVTAVANLTSPDAHIDEWIEAEHTATCGSIL